MTHTSSTKDLGAVGKLAIGVTLSVVSTLVLLFWIEQSTSLEESVFVTLVFLTVYVGAWVLPKTSSAIVLVTAAFAGAGWAIASVPAFIILAVRARGRRNFSDVEILRIAAVCLLASALGFFIADFEATQQEVAFDSTGQGSSGGNGNGSGAGSVPGTAGNGSAGSGGGGGGSLGSGSGSSGNGGAGSGNDGAGGSGGTGGSDSLTGLSGQSNGSTDGIAEGDSASNLLLIAVILAILSLVMAALAYYFHRQSEGSEEASGGSYTIAAALLRLERIGVAVGRPRKSHEGALEYADALASTVGGDKRLTTAGSLVSAHMFDASSSQSSEHLRALDELLTRIEADLLVAPSTEEAFSVHSAAVEIRR